MRAVLLVSLVARIANADTFEAKASGAVPVHRIENVVWALTAACDKGDDTEQRQCRKVRDARAAELSTQALLVDGDADAVAVGAWNAAKKSVPVTVSACIRCGGVALDGKTYVVKLTAPAYDNARTFPDEAAAQQWLKDVAGAKVQLVVKLAAKPKQTIEGKPALVFDLLAFRAFAPCHAEVIAANPPSTTLDFRGEGCTPPTAEPGTESTAPAPEPPKLEHLTTSMIQDAMAPVVDAASKCFEQYGIVGKAKLRLTILGDGTVAKYQQQGDFVGTPTGACIDAAAKPVTFPKTRKPRESISYPIILQ